VVIEVAKAIGIPLAVALIVWYFKRSSAIFWNTFVGAMVVLMTGTWTYLYFFN
jgi:hypothetical protein